ncbi:MAG TPA: T9SS type A sorting domain-containing protein [Bacteroidia bacterium]|nr:T9SS type A sorting domain-containing protein [Bacteroidia bacterium]
MKKFTWVLCLLLLSLPGISQSVSDPAVQLKATVQSSPPQITLNWAANGSSTQYQVFRKLKTATNWGSPLALLSSTVNQYLDNTAAINTNYEYRVIRVGSNYTGYGYINAGIQVAETDFRGKLILLVDSTCIQALSLELKRLVKDMEGDGWQVIRHDVDRNGSVPHVKSLILTDYNIDPVNTKAVFLFGHVPVPYSGNINPDGHPDHLGAWPADVYYGELNGTWTDINVTSTTASPPRTQNIPGDGKFDQSLVPNDVELQVGRVDLSSMSSFSLSEQQLLKNYLDKDHDYRKKIYVPLKQAVIDDNFGYFSGEAFAASAYKNFPALVSGSLAAADYFTSMSTASYQWSYGCGGGSFTSAGGIGNTTNFASSNLQGVFTMLFGSYFGDWDVPNSFLRAPLAQGNMLTNMWSGRPHYQLHHMGLGENIGYSLLITQNNPGNLYFASPTGISGRWIHNALMGDPTLRNDVVAPVSNVVATKTGNHCLITWTPSSDTAVKGYHVYLRNDSIPFYTRINAQLIPGTSYLDSCLLVKGVHDYMVRALKLEEVPSGSYYNLSEGISDTAYNSSDFSGLALFTSTLIGTSVQFQASSTLATQFSWTFGNGQSSSLPNPVATYTANGNYPVQLIAFHPCAQDTEAALITIWEVGLPDQFSLSGISLFPNPTSGQIQFTAPAEHVYQFAVYDRLGRLVYETKSLRGGEEVNLEHLGKGLYQVKVSQGNQSRVFNVLLN